MPKLLFLLLLMLQVVVKDNKVTLVWDANSETDLSGYKVYVGHSSRVYDPAITTVGVTPSPTYTVTNLANGTYYFAVTAFNNTGLESGYSNEVSATVMLYDLNNDGWVNVIDLQLLVNAILGISNVVGADLNGDGSVNVIDLQLLVNTILSGS
jgi:hypothetical protein